MDYKILSLGKLNHEYDSQNFNSAYASFCYFDWFKLKNLTDVSGAFAFDYDTLLNERYNSEEGFHVHETMLLMSPEDDSFPDDKKALLYISLINVPMWDEAFACGSEYADVHEMVAENIEKQIEGNRLHIKLYRTFDHCDFVLICDGSEVSLENYLELIKKIRTVTVSYKDKQLAAVLDIVTVYGYNSELPIEASGLKNTGRLNAVLSLNTKNDKGILMFSNPPDGSLVPKPVYSTMIAGRYDCMIFWENISYDEFYCIAKTLEEQKQSFYASRIHIGYGSISQLSSPPEVKPSGIAAIAENKFNELYTNLECALTKPLLLALKEIHCSICTMLQNGFSQYYILCFYESFYSFMEYISKDKYINAWRETGSNEEEIRKQKLIREETLNMFRLYFTFLNTLNASTIHNEHQFLQIASYHMMYFDAPPKLIAFYTAMANKMAKILNSDDSNRYTFLITPDFKEEIYVDGLTGDKTANAEHNILIIHMNEESMYDVLRSLRILGHEIAHHIGQSSDMRKYRCKAYIRCFVAWALAMSASDEIFPEGFLLNEKVEFFKRFAEHISEKLFPDNWYEMLDLELSDDVHDVTHYTEYFITAYGKRISLLEENDVLLAVQSSLEALEPDGRAYINSGFVNEFWRKTYEEVCQKASENYNDEPYSSEMMNGFVINSIADEISGSLLGWFIKNNRYDSYKIIPYTFRESYADACALKLTSEPGKEIQSYESMFGKFGIDKQEFDSQIRIASVVSYLCEKTGSEYDWLRRFENAEFQSTNPEAKNVELLKCFSLYLASQAKDYLCYVDEEGKTRYKKAVYELKDIADDIDSLINGNIDDIMKRINHEICEYRKRLCE